MSALIQWCNINIGFVTAILSFFTVVLSIIAIIVSIRTARLPFKKKLKLGATTNIPVGFGNNSPLIYSFSATASNVGNRDVFLNFIGFAIVGDDGFKKLFPLNSKSKGLLQPRLSIEVEYMAEGMYNTCSKQNKNCRVYIYAEDSEGKTYKKKWSTSSDILKALNNK